MASLEGWATFQSSLSNNTDQDTLLLGSLTSPGHLGTPWAPSQHSQSHLCHGNTRARANVNRLLSYADLLALSHRTRHCAYRTSERLTVRTRVRSATLCEVRHS